MNTVVRSRPPSGHRHPKSHLTERRSSTNSAKQVEISLPDNVVAPAVNFKPKPALHGGPSTQAKPGLGRNVQQNQSPNKCSTHVFDGAALFKTTIPDKLPPKSVQPNTENSSKSKRRVQSAKPRLEADKSENAKNTAVDTGKQKIKRRPASATDVGSVVIPNGDFLHRVSLSDNDLTKKSESQKDDTLKPYVFGYKSQCFMPGHSAETSQKSTESQRNNNQVRNVSGQYHRTSAGISNYDDEISDLIDYDDDADFEENECSNVSVPKTLRSLLPWQTPGVSQDIIGVDPALCVVFLPSILTLNEDLPVVPHPMTPEQDLAYTENLTQKLPEKQKPKKYRHPWTKLPIDEHVCRHHIPNQLNVDNNDAPLSARQIKIYRNDGSIIHESYTGLRTEQVVRKEIQELEDLMKGIGTMNGCSAMVQYQAEINILQNMVNATMGRVEEIEQREEEKRRLQLPPPPTDHFGLRKFYKEHDELMRQIEEQHTACVEELAVLTGEMDMETAREHFDKRLALTEQNTENNQQGIQA